MGGRFTLLNRCIDFGSLDRIDWRRDLSEGNNALWKMNLAYFGWVVPMLAMGSEDALRAANLVVGSCVAQNDFSVPGVFRDVWHPYAVSHRIINLLSGVSLHARRNPEATTEDYGEILDHVNFCAAFVGKSLENDLQYNHLLKNYLALSVYAASLEAVPEWLMFLRRGVPRSIAQQVLSDGGQAERAPMYQLLTLLDVRAFLAAKLFPDWAPSVEPFERNMSHALAVMSHPDGDIALFNDSWLGEGPRASAVLQHSTALSDGSNTLPITGYTRLASGGNAVLFDHGACGPDDNPATPTLIFYRLNFPFSGNGFSSIRVLRLILRDCCATFRGLPPFTTGQPSLDWNRSIFGIPSGSVVEVMRGLCRSEYWGNLRLWVRLRSKTVTRHGMERS